MAADPDAVSMMTGEHGDVLPVAAHPGLFWPQRGHGSAEPLSAGHRGSRGPSPAHLHDR